jgi:hypothetical protein
MLYMHKKLALTSLTSGGRSVGVVRLRTKSHGVFFFVLFMYKHKAFISATHTHCPLVRKVLTQYVRISHRRMNYLKYVENIIQ